MPVAPQMVSANEAAALAMVEIRDVHRAFDEHLLPEALLGGAGQAGRSPVARCLCSPSISARPASYKLTRARR